MDRVEKWAAGQYTGRENKTHGETVHGTGEEVRGGVAH